MQNENSQSIKRIVIAGGGTSGWMAAALLSRHLRADMCEVTVVAPDDGAGLGVGEATIPSMLRLLSTLQADEAEFMRACHATWKLGIQFADWVTKDRDNWHPFGVCGARIDGRDLFPFWLNQKLQGGLQRPYHSYSLHWAACLAGKCPHSQSIQSPIVATQSYAFHLDAAKFADWLRELAKVAGVKQQSGRIVDTNLQDDGLLKSVVLDDGQRVEGDFFIDCTGFSSQLLRGTLQDPWVDWGQQLLCDRAVAVRGAATSVVPPYTRSLATTAGWIWEIPLAQRKGYGYVYSSDFVTDDQAWQQLREHSGLTEDTDIAPQLINMHVGRQTSCWKQNVLAIGLSAGFVEPLESSGLHLTQVGIEQFLELFPSSGQWSSLQSEYNTRMTRVFDEVRDFVQLHYHLSHRDEPFWVAARDLALSPELHHRLKLYDEAGVLPETHPDAFPDASYYYLLAGYGRLPRRAPALAMSVDAERLQFVLKAIQDQNQNIQRDLPLNEEVLKSIHNPAMSRAL